MENTHAPPPRPLYKQNSWSPDTLRDETWQRRKSSCSARRLNRSKSVSEDDLEELKACIELGFGFDSPVIDPKLSDTLPALEFYHAVNTQCSKSVLTGWLIYTVGLIDFTVDFFDPTDDNCWFFLIFCFRSWWCGDGEDEVEAVGPVGRLRGSAIIFFYLNLKNIFSIVNYKFNSYLFYFLYQSLHLLNLEKSDMLLL